MIITPTDLKDLYVIKREPRTDERGFFVRVFAKEELAKMGIDFDIVHINQALSVQKGTLRGLHSQLAPKQEIKFIHCIKGKVFDVAVDMREDSPTYQKWFGVELSEDNNTMICIPKGFAHGYQSLTDNSVLEYLVSEYYAPEYEKGFRWNDPKLDITWPVANPILSPKDQNWPLL
ncbi:MAG TPA: dTDP-4-dehydrorhamnose 3,5-epimerase [Candidatus Sulfotelmatobacter sp.]|jgi:dTDP-4-dehydrorhamnose 3,5-epimerase|nr:dTDP-4-dehydrorhamnose 3,5-epimerase [Candidatus Sulfotelmatobacter sp.]